jgi:hypothetical protein
MDKLKVEKDKFKSKLFLDDFNLIIRDNDIFG